MRTKIAVGLSTYFLPILPIAFNHSASIITNERCSRSLRRWSFQPNVWMAQRAQISFVYAVHWCIRRYFHVRVAGDLAWRYYAILSYIWYNGVQRSTFSSFPSFPSFPSFLLFPPFPSFMLFITPFCYPCLSYLIPIATKAISVQNIPVF